MMDNEAPSTLQGHNSIHGDRQRSASFSKYLQAFWVDESTVETGEEIGRGAYGTVFKIRRWGVVCAAKKLHDLPLQLGAKRAEPSPKKPDSSEGSDGSPSTRARSANVQKPPDGSPSTRARSGNVQKPPDSRILAKFEKECHLLSNLRHPYIVQFLGVYIDKGTNAPVIIMEYLPMSLASCVEKKPTIPRYLQISMLSNIALGLAYLHGHSPPIIHRDLTANNILLTSNMVAKIADLGVARILDLTPKRAIQLTQAPGTAAYMPPEAFSATPTYDRSIDVFSFGALVLHLVSQQWPTPSEAVRVVANGKLAPVSEAKRRSPQLELVGKEHSLYQLIIQCLQNDPAQRPDISNIVLTLNALQAKYPLPSTSYLDLLQVLESNRNQLEAKGTQLAASKDQLKMITSEMDSKDQEIAQLKEQIKVTEKRLAGSLKGLLLWGEDKELATLNKDTISPPSDSLLPTQSTFTWKRDEKMPEGMYGAKGVFLDDKLYIGGGDCKEVSVEKIIFEYDVNGVVRKWTPLPPAPVVYFSLAVVNKSLTLVGGLDLTKKAATNQLTVWNKEQQQWGTAFPAMPTARQDATVVTHKLWLFVAGGVNLRKPLYNVELFDSATFHWHTIRPLPKPSVGMTGCVVKGVWYLLGGTNFVESTKGETGPKEYLFSLLLDENVATNSWKVLTETPHYCSTAVPFGEHLMALGGSDSLSAISSSNSMFMYSPSLERWLFVGSTPTARSQATCIVLSKSRLMVLGGRERNCKFSKCVEVLHC